MWEVSYPQSGSSYFDLKNWLLVNADSMRRPYRSWDVLDLKNIGQKGHFWFLEGIPNEFWQHRHLHSSPESRLKTWGHKPKDALFIDQYLLLFNNVWSWLYHTWVWMMRCENMGSAESQSNKGEESELHSTYLALSASKYIFGSPLLLIHFGKDTKINQDPTSVQ